VFVSQDGQRSRTENVDWERIPLEFVYIDPYLYIVYCDFLEIVKVSDWTGINSETLTAGRTMFKCQSAHCVGFGPKKADVIFSVSSPDRVELHLFNHTESVQTSSRSILKRKLNDTLSSSSKSGCKKKF